TDGLATSNTATVSITVKPVNDAPIAGNDTATTNEDTPVDIRVLANDTDIDPGTTLTHVVTASPLHGTTTVNTDRTITYTPAANYAGSDSFTYTATDGLARSNTATVSITVKPVNDAPIAGNDTATTNEDTPVAISVLANDTDIDPGTTLTPVVTTGPLHGTTTVNADRTITYTPAANYAGPDSFTYTATDGLATSNTATVSITVTPSNAPTAGDDVITIPEDSSYEGNLLNNDTDPDSTTLTVTTPGTTTTDLGTLTVTTHGAVFFSPTPNASGSQTFTYTITDGQSTDTATITVTVTAVPDAPTANDDTATTNEDTPRTIRV